MNRSDKRVTRLLTVVALCTLGAILGASMDKKARQLYEAQNLPDDQKLKQLDQKE
ncbi:unnamed protein product [Calypogeia fissa]